MRLVIIHQVEETYESVYVIAYKSSIIISDINGNEVFEVSGLPGFALHFRATEESPPPTMTSIK